MTTVLNSLNQGLHTAFRRDERVFLLGEDVLDPYGGAFKVTRGLSSAFPDRVMTTPISEAGITGIATGMSLRGFLPIIEIMFGDFITLAADQIVNHLAKFRWMYNDQVTTPVVIRTPMGGRRGYGPTHSQTLEKILMGIPGLMVTAPTHFGDPGELLIHAVLEEIKPVIFIENKLLYLVKLFDKKDAEEFEIQKVPGTDPYPAYRVRLQGAPEPQITIMAYGHMAELAQKSMLRLAYEMEVFTELVVLTQMSPLNLEPLLTPRRYSEKVLIVEEGTRPFGWGSEVLAQLAEVAGDHLKAADRLGALNVPVPASKPLEEAVLPSVDDIIRRCRQMVDKI